MRNVRPDLAELTDQALTALANPGFVRRARKDLTAGRVPELDATDDGEIVARFVDGVVTRLPPAVAIRDARCSCPASGWCRHRVVLVLAYRNLIDGDEPVAANPQDPTGVGKEAEGEGDNPPGEGEIPIRDSQNPCSEGNVATSERTGSRLGAAPWLPDFTESALAEVVPPRTLRRAGQLAAAEPAVRLDLPGGVPTARLAMSTVQFFSTTALAHARCDCRLGGGCEHVALAVWSFAAADPTQRLALLAGDTVAVRLDAGGEGPGPELDAMIEDWAELRLRLWRAGAAAPDAGTTARLTALTERARRSGWGWVVADLTEVADQLAALHRRSTAADPLRLFDLLAETGARLSAAAVAAERADLDRSAAQVLGVGVPGEVELAHLRLAGLGVRCWQDEDEVVARVHLADPDTGQVSVLQRRWPANGTPVRDRRLLGQPLHRVAESQVVTSSARRRALGIIDIVGTQRLTSLHPLGQRSWDFATTELSLAAAEPASSAPDFVGPRRIAGSLRVVTVDQVRQWGWDAAGQSLVAQVVAEGREAVLELPHSPLAPGAVDTLAGLLAAGTLRRVSAEVQFRGGVAHCAPLAAMTDTGVLCLATQPESSPVAAGPAPVVPRSAHGRLVHRTRQELTAWLRRGLGQQGRGARERLVELAGELTDAGLHDSAARLREASESLGGRPAVAVARFSELTLLLAGLDARL